MKKHILAFCLALALCLGLGIPAPAEAKGKKLIALTFDDGPDAITSTLLDGLKERGARVTFFTVGKYVPDHADIVARAYREGHQIANHTYEHATLTNLSDDQIVYQVTTANQLLDEICGEGTRYMVRAPHGFTNSHVLSLIGAPVISWSQDTYDWAIQEVNGIKKHLLEGASDGAIILLHDPVPSTPEAALQCIDYLQQKGYEFVTVQELFRRRGVPMYDGTLYTRCKSTGVDYGRVTEPVLSSELTDEGLRVTMKAQSGVGIWYTLDGSDVNQTSARYTGPILVNPPCTIKAVAAYTLNGDRSATVSLECNTRLTQPPVISIQDDTLTMEGRTEGAQIYYTLDGSTASTSSTLYTGPVSLTPGTVVHACAGGEGFYTSRNSVLCLSRGGNVFTDVLPSSWYADAVDGAVASGLMQGTGSNAFAPDRQITRGEFVTALYRADNPKLSSKEIQSVETACPFQDVKAGAYDEEAIAWAWNVGLAKGDGTGLFHPDSVITRQEIATMLASYLNTKDKVIRTSGYASHFTDANSIASWAVPGVNAVVACGLMRGDNSNDFLPTQPATRAQVATILIRLDPSLKLLPTRTGTSSDPAPTALGNPDQPLSQ